MLNFTQALQFWKKERLKEPHDVEFQKTKRCTGQKKKNKSFPYFIWGDSQKPLIC